MIRGRLKLAGLRESVREAASWCLDVAQYYGVPVTVTSGHRTWAEQERLYRNYQQCLASGSYGRTPDCMYPANPPGDSAHNYGLAFDSVVPAWAQEWWTYVRRYAGFDVPPGDVIHAAVPNWRQYVRPG